MKKLLLIVFTFISSYSFAQQGWVWQNPKPTGSHLEDIAFVNANTVLIKAGGTLYKSTDGGASWRNEIIFPASAVHNTTEIISIKVFDENTYYVLGLRRVAEYPNYNYTLLRTFNGGQSWDTLHIRRDYRLIFKSMQFINQSTGYCFADESTLDVVYKTTDAGVSWNRLSINSNNQLRCVAFSNESTGIVISAAFQSSNDTTRYYRTTDGGANWSQHLLPMYYSYLSKPTFLNALTGFYIAGANTIFRTNNGGLNFTSYITPSSISDIKFVSPTTGYFCGSNGIYKSVNSGTNWYLISTASCFNINFFSPTNGYAGGFFGDLFKTTNGDNWTQLTRHYAGQEYEELRDVGFANANTGFVVGEGVLLRTTNGGDNWDKIESSTDYHHIKFFNENTGIISGEGFMKRTTNGGMNWINNFTGHTYFTPFEFVNQTTGFVRCSTWTDGNTYMFLKTTDAGATWMDIDVPNSAIGKTLSFINPSTGFSLGSNGIYKTLNGGLNWSVVSTSLNIGFDQEIKFLNANTGIAISVNGGLQRTTNGGLNWTTKIYSSFLLRSMEFVNENTGYVTGGDYSTSVIFKTVDGGDTWRTDNNGFTNYWNGMHFINPNTGWMVGVGQTIVKTTTGGNISVKQISSVVPDKFYLEQNYPNPFNPITNIKFSLPEKSFVKLKVFDLLGRELQQLVNESLTAGEYKYDFNASLLPSGIYFYKLETENFSETRKMVLIK